MWKTNNVLRMFCAVMLGMVAANHAVADGESSQDVAPDVRRFSMGFTPFPWDISLEAVATTYEGIVTCGDMIAHHIEGGVPWPEALEDKPFSTHLENDWRLRKERTPKDYMVYVALNCLNMGRNGVALYHGEREDMPLPDAFKDKQLNDPAVKTAYLNYCRRAVKHFNPDYLAIGIEVNELTYNTPEMWPGFVELYTYVYGELKKSNPALPIFATMTLHSLLREDVKELQREKIKQFLPLNDIAGISFYSFINTLGKPERPQEAFDWLHNFIEGKPIAITETAFPAESTRLGDEQATLPGDPENQAAYVETLLDNAKRNDYLFVVWFLYRDYDALWEKIKATAPGWAVAWRDSGMVDGEGNRRPALDVWKRFLATRYSRPPRIRE